MSSKTVKRKRPYLVRLRKPPPFLEDSTLKNIGMGILIGEGYAICVGRVAGIAVQLCDRKAVEIVAKSWGTAVYPIRKPLCKPTPENPEGHSYGTQASGTRAEIIMRGYEPHIIGTQIHEKYLRKKQECVTKPRARERRRHG